MGLVEVFTHPRLGDTARRLCWAMVVLGVAMRLYVAFVTRGNDFDITSYELVRSALSSHPLDLYGIVNTPDAPHWPYPPAFFPWVLVSGWVSNLTGVRFDGLIQVAPILADIALAWTVQAYLGQQGAGERVRLAAVGLVALGPSFAVVSGFAGQIDSLCILPAVLGLWIWIRLDSPQRAVVAGLLIGLGLAIKAPAGLVLLALVPSARSFGELVKLAVTAAAVPIVLLLPFLVANFGDTVDGLTANRGLPGFGGISLLIQPNLSSVWLRTDPDVSLSSLSRTLFDNSAWLTLMPLLLVTAIMYRWRTKADVAVVIVWLTYFTFGPNFGLTYLVLGLPFFVMMGRLRQAAAIQAAALVPMLMLYIDRGRSLPLEAIYTPILLVILLGFAVWWVMEFKAMLREDPRHGSFLPRAPQPERSDKVEHQAEASVSAARFPRRTL